MKTATRTMTCIGAALAILLLAAPTQSGSQLAGEVQVLRASVADLQDRMEAMEGLMSLRGGYRPSAPSSEPAEPRRASERPRRVMVLDAVRAVERDPEEFEELDRLEEEVKALERSVDSAKQRTASMSGSGGYRGGSYGHRVKDTGSSRRRAAHGQMLADYQQQLRAKQGEMKRLERELEEPRQIIIGQWEGAVITLQSNRDLSRLLDRIDPGDALTWEGRRIRHDSTSQEWAVTRVDRVDDQDLPE
jgi:outer membrane murein-binding lipoprotein Lpp